MSITRVGEKAPSTKSSHAGAESAGDSKDQKDPSRQEERKKIIQESMSHSFICRHKSSPLSVDYSELELELELSEGSSDAGDVGA